MVYISNIAAQIDDMTLKQQLIKEIEKINDDILLEQLTALIKESDQNYSVEISEDQKHKIKHSQQQVKDGEIHSHEDVMRMLKNA